MSQTFPPNLILENRHKLFNDVILSEYSNLTLDLTYLKTYAIDDKDTLEVDDAISYEDNGSSVTIWIHIASTYSAVKFNSKLEKYARERISTLYLGEDTEYMFPQELISKTLTIKPNHISQTLTIGININKESDQLTACIQPAYIKANYNLTYEEADELIDYAPLEEIDLSYLSEIFSKRRANRITNTKLDINRCHGRFSLHNGSILVQTIDDSPSRILVSECMIIYNQIIAEFCCKNNIVIPYRYQSKNPNNSSRIKSSYTNPHVESFHQISSLGRSGYSLKPSPHYSLDLTCYTQSTSPIRRYIDFLVQHQVCSFIYNQPSQDSGSVSLLLKLIDNGTRTNVERYRQYQSNMFILWLNQLSSVKHSVYLLRIINQKESLYLIHFEKIKFNSMCFIYNLKVVNESLPFEVHYIKNDSISDIPSFKYK